MNVQLRNNFWLPTVMVRYGSRAVCITWWVINDVSMTLLYNNNGIRYKYLFKFLKKKNVNRGVLYLKKITVFIGVNSKNSQ